MQLKRELVTDFRQFFGPSYPDPKLANKIRVSLEWPVEQIHYPAIYITYSEGPIRNMGVGHVEYDVDDHGFPIQMMHYQFDGQVNFNVLALSPIERDEVGAGLINLLAMNEAIPEFSTFRNEITDGDYIFIVLNTEQITPQGENTAPVPWENENEQIYGNTYSVPIHGEFYSNPDSGELITIADVAVWPYKPGEVPHWTP